MPHQVILRFFLTNFWDQSCFGQRIETQFILFLKFFNNEKKITFILASVLVIKISCLYDDLGLRNDFSNLNKSYGGCTPIAIVIVGGKFFHELPPIILFYRLLLQGAKSDPSIVRLLQAPCKWDVHWTRKLEWLENNWLFKLIL